MDTCRGRKEAGFTFAELAFALLVLVIAAAVLINHLAINYQTTSTERDRVFAYTKAQAMLAEIQSFVDRGGIEVGVDLDALDDGVVTKDTLTITTDAAGNLVLPDHILSGNYRRDGEWVWSRRVSVQPFSGISNRNVRYVTVRVFRRDRAGTEHLMADLSAVINAAASAFPTTQVMDVYLLAVENIPGWWVYMDTIRPFVESMITDLESRNPGLEFRTHWITKAAFGRDESYRPYFNEQNDSLATIPEVYHYPGKMPAGAASTYYYVPDSVKAHINLDGADHNGYDATRNPHPYALADFFNHAMRYPEELELWQKRVAAVEAREAAIQAAKQAGVPAPPELIDMSKEPTLRLFLEDLYSSPDKYKNALVINLHGELLPMPALRNYSDAARAPQYYPRVRVVTHPEELRTARNPLSPASSDPVKFRVYAYNDNAPTYAGTDILPYMILEVVGMNLTDPSNPYHLKPGVTIKNLPGGVTYGSPAIVGSELYPATWQTPKHYYDVWQPRQMWYYAYFTLPYAGAVPVTRIILANTPVVCPLDANGRGLANTSRAQLYRMPYVPSPVEAARNFTTDLTTIDFNKPKNTARWTLEISPTLLTDNSFWTASLARYNPPGDVTLEVRTHVWAGTYNPGVMWPPSARLQPENRTSTYTWWADSAEDVPITERAQFNGDPRHMPYKDCFAGATDFPDAYNWFHNDFYDGTVFGVYDYAAIDPFRVRDRWNNQLCTDVPRYMELLRKGLTRSRCVYTTLTGYSYYYLGIGNDIGYDAANGYANSIPSNLVPHGVAGSGYIDTITGSRRWVRGNGTNYWWGMPWLGELYPDSAQTMWSSTGSGEMRGNLDPGNGTNKFYQDAVANVYAASNRLAYGTVIMPHQQRTQQKGCIAFFNIGASGSTFDHVFTTGNGTLTATGSEVAGNYNLEMPPTTPVTRPFRLNAASTPGEEWNFAPYATERFSASLYRTYMTHASGTGSGIVKLVDNTGRNASYIVVNGIDRTVTSGSSFIAKWSLLTLAHSFFEAGVTSNTLRIKQLPRVELQYPNDISELITPTTIDIQYDVTWTRWDGLPYTAAGAFNEDESELEYAIMYSSDGGATWLHVQDDSPATPGARPSDPAHLVSDVSIGAETYTWSVPSASFPDGSYHLRIDCFRQGAQVHYSYHRTQIYIQR